jgi:hypothetical protein
MGAFGHRACGTLDSAGSAGGMPSAARGAPRVPHEAGRPPRPAGIRRERGTLVTYPDTLSVSVVRGLRMDAVQPAESGHPGTPTGTAPVPHTLCQRHLRPDPKGLIRSNRDRFVTSEGHASTLPWSLPHLAGARAVDPDHEVLGRPAVTPEDLESFRLPLPRAPRAQLAERCGENDGTVRPGRRQSVGATWRGHRAGNSGSPPGGWPGPRASRRGGGAWRPAAQQPRRPSALREYKGERP